MHPGERLRELIARDSVAYLPGVHDALSAKIAAQFPVVDGLQQSGYGTAATHLGYPDMNFTSLKETTDVVRSMVRAAGGTPVVVDGDTGYGGLANLKRTIPDIEDTGAAGVFIEDQSVPKQCGLMEGKDLVDTERMAAKIQAALEARERDEFVVMARTDAYGEEGLDEAIRRGQRFAEAGAEAFLLGDPVPLDDIETIVEAVDIPYYALGVHSDDAEFETWHPLAAYDRAGVSLVSDVAALLQFAVTAMEEYMEAMDAGGTDEAAGLATPKTLAELSTFLGATEYGEFEDRFRQRIEEE